jgi:hypothetical protein
MIRLKAMSTWIKAVRCCFLLGLALQCFATAPKASKPDLSWQPPKLVGGSPVLFEVSAPAATHSVSGSWFGHEISFFRRTGTNSWYALACVPIETVTGSYELRLREELGGGKIREFRQKIKISRASYPSITVKVAKQYTEPSAEQLRAIEADKEVKAKILGTIGPQRLWAGPFQPPVEASISDVFGTARVFNGKVQSRHQGLDFGVSAGTPVRAINRGTVILARPLYFEGNCVVLDHGQGLLSLYLHLSEFRVKEGQEVEQGELIALSGGTGRASGPHLHLAVRWQGLYLNPAILLKIQIP